MKCWYNKNLLTYLLLPLAAIFKIITVIRRKLYVLGFLFSYQAKVPVIVVGNITVGGTGKTPLVIYLIHLLQASGYRVGVVSRGYKGHATDYPLLVTAQTTSALVGDEPQLIFHRTNVAVVVDPKRVNAAKYLIDHDLCDVIISDDGLQHYALKRDIEIAVIDGDRRFGNGYFLPAGPLRESVQRLKSVDFMITNGEGCDNEIPMNLSMDSVFLLNNLNERTTLAPFKGQTVHAVAGIGNPSRFFNGLRQAGLEVIEHAFPDHHIFKQTDLLFQDARPIFMTEKDAVKCLTFELNNCWVVQINAVLPEIFDKDFLMKLKAKIKD